MRTMCGAHWMKVVILLVTPRLGVNLQKLRHHGLTFPWIDSSAKSFAGLGSSTVTLEKRNLPFCIQVGEGSFAGAMESHEVDTEEIQSAADQPFCSGKTRLDQGRGTMQNGDLEVPKAQRSHTGLLL